MTRYWGEDAAVMGRRVLSGIDRWQVRKHRGSWCVFEPGAELRYVACLNWAEAVADANERARCGRVFYSPSVDEDARGMVDRLLGSVGLDANWYRFSGVLDE